MRAAALGERPLLDDERAEEGSLRDPAVSLIRRSVLGPRSAGPPIELAEAEALVRVDHACSGNVPAWASLYAVTLASALMAEAGWRVPDRSRLAKLEAELNALTSVAAPGRPLDRLRLALATKGDSLRDRFEAEEGPVFEKVAGSGPEGDDLLRMIEDGPIGPSRPALTALLTAFVPDMPHRLGRALLTN